MTQFILPAEWHRQSAVLLTWPHVDTDWAENLADIQQVYLHLCQQITRFQNVVIACHSSTVQQDVLDFLSENKVDLNCVRTFVAPCNDTWARDHGPITLISGEYKNSGSNVESELTDEVEIEDEVETQICDFTFNAWGDKYQSNLDDKINQNLIMQPFCNLQHYQNYDMVLEGGSIESDGQGSLLTTERCLLNPNRNSKFNKDEIELGLKQLFNVSQVHWLKHGYLPGDDTDAHIDTLARFSPNGIVYVTCDQQSDHQKIEQPHADELKAMEQEIKALTDVNGNPYVLYPLPSPSPIFNSDQEQLPATYANYLIINDAVLVPTYNDINDATALDVIATAYPNREIIGIDCRAVIQQFGSLHCLTMQIPEGFII